MREGIRRILLVASAGGLFACLLGLVVLRAGRPLFYTDGAREWSAFELRESAVLTLDTPVPELELPGPVEGRVQTLPDGRLLYARVLQNQTTALVLFDPARRGLPPETCVRLDSPGHDLAPALAADGWLYFASDRQGSAGGFDLFRARYQHGAFGRVERLPDGINGPLDETDPAPDPRQDSLVFVRRDPDRAGGRNGTLMIGTISGEFAAVPLWEPGTTAALDRDPAFTADGAALWFVRDAGGIGPLVVRAPRHGARFGAPVTPAALLNGGPFRAPEPTADGFGLWLVKPMASPEPLATALRYRAAGRAVQPWWPGQALIELWLVCLALVCLVLLLLLWLGRRWRQLDVITWCVLLSLLLHLLLMLCFTDLEIVRRWLPPAAAEGGLEVELQIGSADVASTGLELDQRQVDVSAELVRPSDARELAAAEPALEATEAERRQAERSIVDPGETPRAQAPELRASVEQALPEVAVRTGTDAREALAAEQVEVAKFEAAPAQAARASDAASGQSVTAPSSKVDGVSRVVPEPSGEIERTSALPAAAAQPTTAVSLIDAPATPLVREGADNAEPLRPAPVAREGELASDLQVAPAAASALEAAGGPAEPAPGAALAQADRAEATLLPAADGLPAARIPELAAVLRDPVESAAPSRSADAPKALTIGQAPPVERGAPMPIQPKVARLDAQAGSPLQPSPESSVAPSARPAAPRSRVVKELPQPATVAKSAILQDAPTPSGESRVPDPSPAPSKLAAAPVVLPAPSANSELAPARPAAPVAHRAAAGALAKDLTTAAPRASNLGERPALPSPLATTQRPGPEPVLQDRVELTACDAPDPRTPAPAKMTPLVAAATTGPDQDAVLSPRRERSALGHPASGLPLPAAMLERAPRDPGAAVATPEPTAALPDLYHNRFGAQKAQALEQFGGTAATEHAVAMGLRYLASIQQRDGTWGDRDGFDPKYGQVLVGKTGLCLLAFLGAGHSQVAATEHQAVVKRAVRALLTLQDPDSGHFGVTSAYSHGIATYALAECYGMTKDQSLRAPVENAVQWILANQSRSRDPRNRGGWGYFSTDLTPEDRWSRTSITAWMVMALESAKLSGLQVPSRSLTDARQFLVASFDTRNGYFRYSHSPDRLNSAWPTLPASTPASTFALLLLGVSADDPAIQRALQFTVGRRPREYARASDDDFVNRARGNVYFWYYGSLACFMAGGDTWEQWNQALRRVLPEAQEADGSFAPIDPYARIANDTEEDRSYTTAMCVLSLEVYYRYFTPLLEKR